jgi:hypothetical protein
LSGELDGTVSLRLSARPLARPLFSVNFPRPGPVPPLLATEVWRFLPQSRLSEPGLDVEVWADREQVAAGSSLRLFLRASQAAFVAVFRVWPNGTIDQVFPGDDRAMEFIREGETVALPAEGRGQALKVGTEGPIGFWALAAASELPVRVEGQGDEEDARRIRGVVLRLPEARWSSSCYGVRVLTPVPSE